MKITDYRNLNTGRQNLQAYELTDEQQKQATTILKNKNVVNELIKSLNSIGILGEDENAFILLFALASYKFSNPFSVLCLAKSGIGKSYILQKLSECMLLQIKKRESLVAGFQKIEGSN